MRRRVGLYAIFFIQLRWQFYFPFYYHAQHASSYAKVKTAYDVDRCGSFYSCLKTQSLVSVLRDSDRLSTETRRGNLALPLT